MTQPTDTIFLLREQGRLERVPQEAYESEDLLQSLIADYPDLLAGEQIEPDDPIRWLLVSREAGVPDAEGASDRWAVDHLLLDQHGRPTFVEVKRSTNPEIRRAIVGQMLDYAANAQTYWPLDRIRTLAAERSGGIEALDETVAQLLGSSSSDDLESQIEDYWRTVEEKLRLGEVRLLFVADKLPRELRRVIEFLNEQMPRIEVLGIEVRQYVGSAIKALVPRVVGQTETAREGRTSSRPGSKTTREEFLAACPESARAFFEELFDEAATNGLAISWGTRGFSLRVPRANGKLCSIWFGYPCTMRRDFPFIEASTEYLSPEDDADGFRKRFQEVAPFSGTGAYIMHLAVTPENIAAARRAMQVLWQVAAELKCTPITPAASGETI